MDAALTTGVAATSKLSRPASATGESRHGQIASFGCPNGFPPEKFFAHGATRIGLAFDRSPGRLRDLATSENLHASRRWEFTLAPYELRSFGVARDFSLNGFGPKPPPAIAAPRPAGLRRALASYIVRKCRETKAGKN